MNKIIFLCLLTLSTVFAQSYKSNEAYLHIGENATICGEVKSTHFASRSRGEPTFLNLGKAYPEQFFTVVIWGKDRYNFSIPEIEYNNKNICVSGYIKEYKGIPQIVLKTKSQIQVK